MRSRARIGPCPHTSPRSCQKQRWTSSDTRCRRGSSSAIYTAYLSGRSRACVRSGKKEGASMRRKGRRSKTGWREQMGGQGQEQHLQEVVGQVVEEAECTCRCSPGSLLLILRRRSRAWGCIASVLRMRLLSARGSSGVVAQGWEMVIHCDLGAC